LNGLFEPALLVSKQKAKATIIYHNSNDDDAGQLEEEKVGGVSI